MPPRLRQPRGVVVRRGRAGSGQPAVAVVRHPLRRTAQFATDHHRRMGPLHRLGVTDDRREIHPLAVEFRHRIGPQLFHRFDVFLCLPPAVREVRAQHLSLPLQPAGTDAEHETPARHQVQRRHLLGQPDGIALRHQADPRPQPDRFRGRRRGGQVHQRVNDLVDPPIGVDAWRSRGGTRCSHAEVCRNYPVLRRPQRAEPQLLHLPRQPHDVKIVLRHQQTNANVRHVVPRLS